MKVLLVGSGGREHALAWGLARSPSLTELHAAPGNPGIARLGHCHPVRAEDGEGLLALARSLDVELVVVGPEAPLVAGVGDELRHAGLAVFGPSAAAARIEGSKSFAKEVMAAAGVPTADTLAVARAPCVLKVDGLAAGKGVFVCHTREELDRAMQAVAAFEGPIVIEELLEGEEVSVFALVDGSTVVPLAPAQDFKRLDDGDRGPNTGGMGAYSPVPALSDELAAEVAETVHRPVVEELARRGTPFVGLLYAGLMLTADGLRVLEFNCRFGDPETQVVVPRLATDLLEAIAAAAGGELAGVVPAARDEAAVTVVRRPRPIPSAATPARRSRASTRPRRAAHSCSTPGRRAARRRSSRTAAASSRSPASARRSATRVTGPTTRSGAYRSPGCASAPTSPRRPHVSEPDGPLVGILVGSESDRERMQGAMDELDARGIAWEFDVRSAHRTPDAVAEYARTARERGLRVLICGAGLAAALPGAVAAHTDLPVIGVPLRSSLSVLDGLDALLAIAQMPPGVPVAAVGVDNAKNAGVLAARVLGA